MCEQSNGSAPQPGTRVLALTRVLLKEQKWGPWNATSKITQLSGNPLPNLTGNYTVLEAAHSPAQQVGIPAAQILSWYDNTNSSECDPRLEMQSTCNYCNCPLFFCLAFLLIRVIWQSGFYTCPMDNDSIQWIDLKKEHHIQNADNVLKQNMDIIKMQKCW